MKVHFLGVGEACDPEHCNTSLLVLSGSKNHYILLDCGFTTPHRYFKDCSDPEQLEALWISHFHGDHFFGVPLLLLRFWEMGRTRPLLLVGPSGLQEKVEMALDLAYPGFGRKLRYAVQYLVVAEGDSFTAAGFAWQTAAMDHSQPCLAVRLTSEGKSLLYSGDGRCTGPVADLARGCDLIIQETYRVSGETPGHGSVAGSLALARQAGCLKLALVHIGRLEREGAAEKLRKLCPQGEVLAVLLPEAGETLVL
ncbi:MBL fold metallo-hydrolase [Thiovibrio frasassiensis]|uniref:MBL fold metallo-hydrolase n=1 Tax=Thiovibrio frasassiensis TaxID=2984131 RepID=A0A9X4RM24_9BACT|nr:MBL fold metallo-hydrolase [Thiovibrio frasassiensis]MDG4476334.1 MBL fold metallo-hydrolase [Thiovibrio frasassiensis]